MANMFQNLQNIQYNPNQDYVGPSPIGAAPGFNQMMNSSAYLAQSAPQYAAATNYSGVLAANEQRAAEAAQQRQYDILMEKKKKLESGDYTRVQKESGGFDFFDPLGNKVTAEEFAKGKGATLLQAISGSADPQDIQAASDYQYLEKIIAAISGKQPDHLKIVQKELRANGIDPDKVKVADLLAAYRGFYSAMFKKNMVTEPESNFGI